MSHHATPGSISKIKDGTEKMTEEIKEDEIIEIEQVMAEGKTMKVYVI
jgi:hypothetical protein